ncbi:MAG: GTP pyrophosphokinase family protein [Defluviitaleaceae bacterium]|nr:GTP pyrophosphokinase family protein [Defluviitaleaceae bacterium]
MDWEKRLLPYKQAVDELKAKFDNITVQLEKTHHSSPIFSVEYRVKTIPSILAKAQRKRIPGDKIEEKIEDIAGIRIICRFVDDINDVVDMIRMREDMRIVHDRNYVDNMKESGYRSYHLIIEYAVITADGKKRNVFCEIQIRTMAMDFWAVLEHNLRYKYRRSIPEDIKRRLARSADAAYMLDTEMNTIREEIVAAEKTNRSDEEVIYEITNIIEELYKVAPDSEVKDLYEQFVDIITKQKSSKLMHFSNQIRLIAQTYRIR